MLRIPYALLEGQTITLEAWEAARYPARFADFTNLLEALANRTVTVENKGQLLLDRVLLHSIPDQEDREAISAPDLPGIFDAIFDLNRVEDVEAKAYGLHSRRMQAREEAARLAAEARQALAGRVAQSVTVLS